MALIQTHFNFAQTRPSPQAIQTSMEALTGQNLSLNMQSDNSAHLAFTALPHEKVTLNYSSGSDKSDAGRITLGHDLATLPCLSMAMRLCLLDLGGQSESKFAPNIPSWRQQFPLSASKLRFKYRQQRLQLGLLAVLLAALAPIAMIGQGLARLRRK